jgi:hypothetical protein
MDAPPGIHHAHLMQNGVFLGNATDQFIRYTFGVTAMDAKGVKLGTAAALHPAAARAVNTLTVTFGAELGIDTGGRFTHSAEIDWAPTMTTQECFGPGAKSCVSTFGFGIWKSVYVVPVAHSSASITHLVPHTFYAGGHPTTMLTDDTHAGFEVRVKIELAVSGDGGHGTISVLGSWPDASAVELPTALPSGDNAVTLTVPAAQTVGVRLWHPHGHGDQALYNITATFTPSDGGGPATTTRRIGFRHVALVTINDTDVAARAAAENTSGTGQFTMFFRVNGAAVYARGGNKVCMRAHLFSQPLPL